MRELYFHFSSQDNYTKPFDSLLMCTAKIAYDGNKEAQKGLLNFYFNQKKYYDKGKSNYCNIAVYTNKQIVTTFSKLRGKEAFDLALEYAEKTECRAPNDVVIRGNLGLNVIIHIINPMIKSVKDGYQIELEYLVVDFDENGENMSYDVGFCERQHKEAYDKLLKAYKEGKIILKEYGED